MTRTIRIVCLIVAATSYVILGSAASAQDDTWRTMYPAWYDVPQPVHETGPGENTYWHDPNLGWGNPNSCWEYGPADAGCPPVWYAKADALFLYRDVDGYTPFASSGPAGPVVLSSSSFDTEFDAAFRITLGRSLGDWYRLEGTYFGSPSWSDNVTVRNLSANAGGGVGNLYSPFSDFGNLAAIPGVDQNDLASAGFSSRLTNAELNLRRRLVARPGVWESSFLVGVRYLTIDETLTYATTSTTGGAASVNYDVTTSNDMIGVQLGLLTQFLIRPRMWIDFDIKGGIYSNDASMAYSFDQSGALTTGADDVNRTSFVGELSLQYNYSFARHWTFYAGYNAFWVTGVALTGDNFSNDINLLTLGPAQIDHRGEVVYHGPNIGLIFAY